ncbi:Gfo/Idh/MocA family oxidoreductase [Cyanobacterium aponinum FACHB-4101]|uniref:Gfo/Idh/MocA family protein n=1 Tax=Cyanobacterium aponinum TaxID=379064 RepID=UPI00167FF847|nr:Gfo/Idh/MocA family oxidoreductase [Cyanobacterium aponinum]MBD2393385.1 Gfo/Idh/MocA family oxidoreductase [Cyanobacterium aponinum FACHB-4101]
MSEKKLGVAIVGTGFGKQIHLPAFQLHPRTEVVAIHHRVLDKAKAIASEYNITHAMDNLEDICRLPEVDIVSISTPPFLHYDMAKIALNHDKHILLEKPLNLNVYETREIYRLAKQKQKIVVADFEFRFIPEWQLLKEYLDNDYVGKTRLIKIDWLVASRGNPNRAWNWYSVKEKGGGALGAIGSHAFDYIHWLFGEIATISAYLGCAIPQRPDPLSNNQLKPVTADDTCLITLELNDGTPVQVNLSSVTYQGRGHWLEIYGEKGTLVLGSDNLKDYVHGFKLYASRDNQPLEEIKIPERLAFPQVFDDGRLAPFLRVVNQLVENIDHNKMNAPSIIEGIYSQLLMDLTHKSHTQKQRLKVPSLQDFLLGNE